MIFHRISNWWLFLPFDQRWTGLVRRELGIGWCFLLFCICVSHICIFIIDHFWACPRDQRWKVRADQEREKKTLWPSFYLFLCSVLISVFTYLCFVICDYRYLAARPFYIYVRSFAYFIIYLHHIWLSLDHIVIRYFLSCFLTIRPGKGSHLMQKRKVGLSSYLDSAETFEEHRIHFITFLRFD